MKKIVLAIYLFIVAFVFTSCGSSASLVDCNVKLEAFKARMEFNNGVVVDTNIDMLTEGVNMFNINSTSNVMFEPLYIELINGSEVHNLIEKKEKIYTVDKIGDKYIAGYFCTSEELDSDYNFDSNYDDYFSIKNLSSLKIKNINNGYKITYDLAEYFDNAEDGFIKNLYDNLDKKSIVRSDLTIDIIFNSETNVKMIYFYEIDTKTDDYEERMQVVQTLIFNIEKVSAITSLDNCYLDVHSYLSSSIDNTTADLVGFDKFYLNSFDTGYTRIAFEKGTYEFIFDDENVSISLYDINKNKVESVDGKTFNVNMDIYFIHFNTTADSFVSLVKK